MLKTYSGVLQEIGDGMVAHQAQLQTKMTHHISYLQIGDVVVRKFTAVSGVAGKLDRSVGDDVTLYFSQSALGHGRLLVGIKQADGKTFKSPSYLGLAIPLALLMLLVGIVTLKVIIGFFIIIVGLLVFWPIIRRGIDTQRVPHAMKI